MYALIDCNNFFVSCERIFRPDLWKRPTAVLSNNDGCIVSRSQEVKDIDVPMGAPLFKVKNLIDKHNIEIISSNFALYGDISNRVMNILEDFSDDVEVYSIDEAFIDFKSNFGIKKNSARNLTEVGYKIIGRIKKELGIPVSVGFAETKTLSKIANEIGKKERRFNDVTNLYELTEEELNKKLSRISVGDIWGIGYNRNQFLKANEIYTALDFKNANQMFIRKKLSVMGERTYLELNGTKCFKLDSNPTPRKGISSTRSFGRDVTKLSELKEAVSSYVAIATRKLREQNSVANYITVYLRTNKFKDKENYFSTAITVPTDSPTDYTPDFTKKALDGLKQIFKPGYLYKKAGIYITDIMPKSVGQYSFFEKEDDLSKKRKEDISMRMDKMNSKYGTGTLHYASEGFRKRWKVKSEMRSPRYTTRWNEILEVKI